jgi:hypothetical protein
VCPHCPLCFLPMIVASKKCKSKRE